MTFTSPSGLLGSLPLASEGNYATIEASPDFSFEAFPSRDHLPLLTKSEGLVTTGRSSRSGK